MIERGLTRVAFPPPLAVGTAAFACAVGAGAVIAPAQALAAVVGAIFVVLALGNLALGVTLFTILSFFEELPGVPSGSASYLKLTGAVLVASALLFVIADRHDAPGLFRDHRGVASAVIFLVALAFGSRLWSLDAGSAQSQALRLLLAVLLFFVVFSAIRRRRHVWWILGAYIGGAVLSALVGFFETSPESVGPHAEAGRLEKSGIGDPNELAAIIVPAIAFASFGMLALRKGFQRRALAASVVVLGLALILTESRGGLVAFGATCLAALVLGGRMRSRALVVVLSVSAIAITYYSFFATPESVERVTNPTQGGGTGRTDLWSVGKSMVRDRPLLGVGIGNFRVVEPRYVTETRNVDNPKIVFDEPKVAHNTYLEVLAELGILGFVAFIGVVSGTLVTAIRAIRRFEASENFEMELVARGAVVGVLGMLAAFVFISAQYEKQLWLLLAFLLALASLSVRDQRDRTLAEAEAT